MNYILIDDLTYNINIVYKDDESGEPLILTSLKEAQEQLKEQCQNGIIVPLMDTVDLLQECTKLLIYIYGDDNGNNDTDSEVYELIKNLKSLGYDNRN